MGTSTARRGPTTGLWRLAKAAATRYMAPEGGAPVAAREVARRYVAALQDTGAGRGQELVSDFRVARMAAQSLGEFGDLVAGSGLTAALETWGVTDWPQTSPEVVILKLTSAWLKGQNGLEASVASTALAEILGRILPLDPSLGLERDGPSLVSDFFGLVLCRRLAFDLGESLEAATPGWPDYHRDLVRLEEEFRVALSEVQEDPPGAGQWQGLAGWRYVTNSLTRVLQRFQELKP